MRAVARHSEAALRRLPVAVRPVAWLATLALALVAGGCGRAGTWTDDPGNWRRIFRGPKPAGVAMIHSWYWRSPHFTMEFEYFRVFRHRATGAVHLHDGIL